MTTVAHCVWLVGTFGSQSAGLAPELELELELELEPEPDPELELDELALPPPWPPPPAPLLEADDELDDEPAPQLHDP